MTRSRAKSPRAPFVVTAAFAAIALIPACGGKVGTPATDSDAGSDTRVDGPQPSDCPPSMPSGACVGSSRCGYGDCFGSHDHFAVCKDGMWQPEIWSCNPPPPPPCPTTAPPVGSSCIESWSGRECLIENECAKSAGHGPTYESFTCVASKWVHESSGYLAKCPAGAPTHGTACGACADYYPDSCNYKYCGMYPSIYAKCDASTKTWNVMEASCNPPPPDGGWVPPSSDAGGADPGDPSPSPP